MMEFVTPTGKLRWNAGVLEQEFHHAGRYEWRAVPYRPDTALATGEVPRVNLDKDDAAAKVARDAGIISPTDCAERLVNNEIERGRQSVRASFGSDGNAGVPGEDDPDFREVDEPKASAFYEFCADGYFTTCRSMAPVQYEVEPGLWKEVAYTRKPEPLHDSDRLTYETVAEILRSFSSPTTGAAGSVHGGQHGFIVYETDGLPFIVSRLAELVTIDDGRTAKDMLYRQNREIERLKILADYQREELTRLEDMARLGLSDDPAAGATLAAVTKERDVWKAAFDSINASHTACNIALGEARRERDELRAALPNFESHVAELTREFDEALATERKANEALNDKLRDEIEEMRSKRNEWQRRALAAEQRGAEASTTLARIRKFCDEVLGETLVPHSGEIARQ